MYDCVNGPAGAQETSTTWPLTAAETDCGAASVCWTVMVPGGVAPRLVPSAATGTARTGYKPSASKRVATVPLAIQPAAVPAAGSIPIGCQCSLTMTSIWTWAGSPLAVPDALTLRLDPASVVPGEALTPRSSPPARDSSVGASVGLADATTTTVWAMDARGWGTSSAAAAGEGGDTASAAEARTR